MHSMTSQVQVRLGSSSGVGIVNMNSHLQHESMSCRYVLSKEEFFYSRFLLGISTTYKGRTCGHHQMYSVWLYITLFCFDLGFFKGYFFLHWSLSCILFFLILCFCGWCAYVFFSLISFQFSLLLFLTLFSLFLFLFVFKQKNCRKKSQGWMCR